MAAALSYIDFAGVKLGAPLNEVEKALKAKDARYTFRPTIEIVWPGNNPPPDAPKSVTTLRAELQVGAFTTEAIDLMPARHPNPPVLIGLARHVGYPNDSGPSLDDLVARLRKEYGNESAVDPTAINDNYARTFSAKWFFDESGQVLRGNLGAQLFNSGCAGYLVPANNQGLCSTLTVLQVRVSASGAGVVHDFILQVKSNPLDFSATETTRAFLRQVEADIAQK